MKKTLITLITLFIASLYGVILHSQPYINVRGTERIVWNGDTCDTYFSGDTVVFKSTSNPTVRFKFTLLKGTNAYFNGTGNFSGVTARNSFTVNGGTVTKVYSDTTINPAYARTLINTKLKAFRDTLTFSSPDSVDYASNSFNSIYAIDAVNATNAVNANSSRIADTATLALTSLTNSWSRIRVGTDDDTTRISADGTIRQYYGSLPVFVTNVKGHVSTSANGYNVVMGNNAFNLTSGGSFNSVFGSNSLSANTSGTYNSVIGSYSLYNNTTGSNNTALGYSTVRTNVSGEYNTGVGSYALFTSTSSANTGVGYQSLQATTSGGTNTALGYYSFANNTTGSNNLALGSYAGSHVANLSNRIYINTLDRFIITWDTTRSPIYILQNQTVSRQIVYLNGQTYISDTVYPKNIITPKAEIESLSLGGSPEMDTAYDISDVLIPELTIGTGNDSLSIPYDGTIHQYYNASQVFKTDVSGYQYGKMPFSHVYTQTDLTISATQNIWYKITGFTTKYSEGFTVAGDSVHITKAGYYQITYTITMSGLNNEVWEFATFKNGAIEVPRQQRYTSTTDVGNGTAPTTFYCDGDDWISYKIRNTVDGDDPTIKYFSAVLTPIYLIP